MMTPALEEHIRDRIHFLEQERGCKDRIDELDRLLANTPRSRPEEEAPPPQPSRWNQVLSCLWGVYLAGFLWWAGYSFLTWEFYACMLPTIALQIIFNHKPSP